MDKTSLQLEPNSIADLDKIADKRGMTRSQVMRKFLDEKIQDCKDKGEIK